jgi:predicted membrane protein
VDMDDSEMVRVDLRMGAGDLRLTDGGAKLARADFAYNVAAWKPEVRYRREGKQGSLVIEQPGTNHTHVVGSTKYSWDLQLNRKVPVDLALHFGAGQARLDLGSLQLRGVEVEMGVGQLDMDLRGVPRHSYNVGIHGGIGQATVRLSADAGVYAEAHGGIGSIKVTGLRQEEGHWVSPSYDRAENKIRIEIQGGIGEVKVIAD